MNSSGMGNMAKKKMSSLFAVGVSLMVGNLLTYLICVIFSVFITIYGKVMTERNQSSPDAFQSITVLLNTFLSQVFYVGFMYVIFLISKFLETIREYLDQVLLPGNILSEKEAVLALRNISIMIDKICDALINIQRCYSINAITFLAFFTCSNIFCLFGVISHFMSSSKDRDDFFIMLIVWNLYNYPFVIWTFVFASRIKNEGEEIHSKILEIYKPTTKLMKSVQTLSFQLNHRYPQLSCGLFVFDWFFVFVIIGTTFSYLLILLQFEIQD